jgi:hypothetical protein
MVWASKKLFHISQPALLSQISPLMLSYIVADKNQGGKMSANKCDKRSANLCP